MTVQIATLISCALFFAFGWFGLWLAKRTIYYAASPEDGAKQDEQAKREKVKQIRESNLKRVFMVYGVIVLVLYGLALVAEPAKKVQAALWPTPTPTYTVTPSLTPTRTPSRTPAASRTPTAIKTGTSGAGNFLTTIAHTPGAATATQGSGMIVVTKVVSFPVTVIVKQTQMVVVTVVNYVVQTMPVTVVVTATHTTVDTPQATATVVTATPSLTYTVTASPTPTATWTHTPTETHTPTATATFVTPTVQETATP